MQELPLHVIQPQAVETVRKMPMASGTLQLKPHYETVAREPPRNADKKVVP